VKSTLVSTPLTATSGVVQAGANGDTVVNLRGLGAGDGTTIEQQVLAIVQFRTIQNPSLSGPTLLSQLIDGLINDGVITPDQGASIKASVESKLVSPTLVGTTTTLTPNPSTNLKAGEPITLTAVVTPASGNVVPTGNVTFADPSGGSVTEPLDGTGKAVYKGVVPAAGMYSVFAKYNGGPGFKTSVSGTISRTVAAH
jgi:Bacterial Ig-like domain (group 3)